MPHLTHYFKEWLSQVRSDKAKSSSRKHTYNSNTCEAKAGGFLVKGQPELRSKILT